MKTGVFAPPPLVGAMPFTDLRAIVGQAVTALEAFTLVKRSKEVNVQVLAGPAIDLIVGDNASSSIWAPRTIDVEHAEARRWPLQHGRVDLRDLDVERDDPTTHGRFVVELVDRGELCLHPLKQLERWR